ncbi:hypothetical protein BO70DRAFT_15091 [Aspergillus heteromorphus CBS 117.55]|uniref:Uncharacterized protein n=1 Tax=Aspergillus heteromorphus CBS 117.55 TaxID=1448321 RepID=A0A317X397_9EURO|nr:uncharacterized protein BO70DRAFT_15091 [Aspergillus heteromorphus CBS 117.55]PWY92621.1 hypothetical protein BO70DRAFT_15091 [Aspergillus heteromorphus CBS 117.55]
MSLFLPFFLSDFLDLEIQILYFALVNLNTMIKSFFPGFVAFCRDSTSTITYYYLSIRRCGFQVKYYICSGVYLSILRGELCRSFP